MRLGLFLTLLVTLSAPFAAAQPFFPVKMDKKWGLINAEGKLVLEPVYDAIGEFKSFGYAVMQRNGMVGLLGRNGQEILAPAFQDLKVLTPDLMAALQHDQWSIINLRGKVVLPPGYDRAVALTDQFLAYLENGLWGVVDRDGRKIVDCSYDQLDFHPEGYFLSRKDDNLGVLSWEGEEILPTLYDDIRIEGPGLIFFKKQNRWGMADCDSGIRIPAEYERIDPVGNSFIRLRKAGKLALYSLSCEKLVSQDEYDDCYLFSDRAILVKRNRLLGLLDACGQTLIPARYNEILPFSGNKFRVNYQGRWGIVNPESGIVLPFEFDYLAPLKGGWSLIRKHGKSGLVNSEGQLTVPALFDQLVVEGRQIKAYDRGALTLFSLDSQGGLSDLQHFNEHMTISIGKPAGGTGESPSRQSPYVLENYEWFYAPAVDKWGLRRLEDGSQQIEPQFDIVRVFPQYGFSLVGLGSQTAMDLERTTYRFEHLYGLVNNKEGLLVTDLVLWDLRISDFDRGFPAARCVLANGRHGLLTTTGKFLCRDYAFIGDFRDGRARASVRGRLSGTLSEDELHLGPVSDYLQGLLTPNSMLDFTQYDLEFEREARLICEDCEWGYIDTLGAMVVSPKYSFARDFVNEVGIVQCGEKWGMLGPKGDTLIPCRYDAVEFLENTDNQIVRIYKREEKYGLIDSLGQLALQLAFDEVGSFREGLLAVKQDGLWGFVDRFGKEVISCHFRAVENFSEGKAAVKVGRQWGFIDPSGKVKIDFKYIRVGNFQNGLAWFFDGSSYGFIDEKGQVAIQPQFDRAFDFEGEVARVVREGKYGLIDPQGRYVLKPKYSIIHPFEDTGLAKAGSGNEHITYVLINRQGAQVTAQSYIEIRPFSDGLAAVKTKNGYGFIDSRGQMVIPDRFAKVSNFNNGLASIQENGQCGYIGRDGSLRIEMAFTKCMDFEEGKAVVYQGYRKAGLIDSLGRFIILPSLDNLSLFTEGRGLIRDGRYRFYYITEKLDAGSDVYQQARAYDHGIAVVQSNGNWGVINQNGVEIIPPKYDRIEHFENGYAKVRITGFSGLSNLKGELIVQPDYEYISYAGQGLFRVEQGEKIGYFDLSGAWVWGLRE
ncbi:MAG: WG repeat-containing protein [Saprospirales bacterium]|nr:WG repeat-containing protein [Saprospirales bacterium]